MNWWGLQLFITTLRLALYFFPRKSKFSNSKVEEENVIRNVSVSVFKSFSLKASELTRNVCSSPSNLIFFSDFRLVKLFLWKLFCLIAAVYSLRGIHYFASNNSANFERFLAYFMDEFSLLPRIFFEKIQIWKTLKCKSSYFR